MGVGGCRVLGQVRGDWAGQGRGGGYAWVRALDLLLQLQPACVDPHRTALRRCVEGRRPVPRPTRPQHEDRLNVTGLGVPRVAQQLLECLVRAATAPTTTRAATSSAVCQATVHDSPAWLAIAVSGL